MGRPDLEVIVWGVPVFLEVKAPGGRASAVQLAEGREITAAGGHFAVVDTVADALRTVTAALHTLDPALYDEI